MESKDADPKTVPACDLLVFDVDLVEEGDGWLVDQYYLQTPC